MPLALLPNGQTTFVKKNLEVSVSLPGAETRASVESAIRNALAQDQRQLFIRVQGGGGFGPWCFWVQWGEGSDCCASSPVMLAEDEHTAEAIRARVLQELGKLAPAAKAQAVGQ